LALSEVLFFLFDPTQHPKFRRQCKGKTEDPQMGEHGWSHRQDQVLLEAASRIRSHSGWSEHDKYKRPLIVVVTKYDAWCSLIGEKQLPLDRVVRQVKPGMSALDQHALKQTSNRLRDMLLKYARELVTAADSFAEEVIYIPVSALGGGPQVIDGGGLGVRPRDIEPMWAEVPMLCALNKATKRLVRSGVRKTEPGKPAAQTPKEPPPEGQAEQVEQELEESPPILKLRETGS
jgi:hypothetical protein